MNLSYKLIIKQEQNLNATQNLNRFYKLQDYELFEVLVVLKFRGEKIYKNF